MAVYNFDNKSAGSNIGAALGSGLSSGLQLLAQNKLQELQQRTSAGRNLSGLQALGFSPDQASSLSQFDPQIIQEIAKQKIREPGQSAALGVLLQALGMSPNDTNTGQEQQLGQEGQLEQNLQSPQSANNPQLNDIASILGGNNNNRQSSQSQVANALNQPGINFKDAAQIIDIVQKQKQQKELADIKREQLELNKQKISATEQREVDKETLPAYHDIVKQHRASKDVDRRLNKMQKLINKGDLSNPVLASFIHGALQKFLGVDFSSSLGPDTEEFEKLSAEFIRNAKDIFGSRITDQDLKAFMKMIPNATQSDEAKVRLIYSIKELNEASKLRYQAAKDVISENDGRRPRDFETLVEDKISEQLDSIAEKFDGIQKTRTSNAIKSIKDRFSINPYTIRKNRI